MTLPGGGLRLQTLGRLATQLFDSTLRTVFSIRTHVRFWIQSKIMLSDEQMNLGLCGSTVSQTALQAVGSGAWAEEDLLLSRFQFMCDGLPTLGGTQFQLLCSLWQSVTYFSRLFCHLHGYNTYSSPSARR